MDVFLGFVSPFPFNWAPNGWALCNGALVPIQQNSALFALLNTQFGGNGTTTFGLPDLRGRTIVGMGQQPSGGTNYQVGGFGGKENVTLVANQVPAPTLSANVAVSTAAPTVVPPQLTNGQTAYLANASGGTILKGLYSTTAPAPGATATIPVNVSGGGGGGNPVSLMNPYLALNFCIAMNGIFPSRN